MPEASVSLKKPAAKKPAAKKPETVAKAIDFPLQLGVIARDLVSGLTGTASAKVEMLNGNVQWNVMPKGDGLELKGGNCVDFHMLEVIGKGVADKVPVPPSSDIMLGNEVEDLVTGFKGTVTERTTFLNGCVYFHVVPKAKKGEDYPSGILLEHKRLKFVGKGVAHTVAVQPQVAPPETPKVTPKPRGTGGPTRSIGRIG